MLDYSLSMKINDSPNSSTRWDFVRKLLEWPDVKEALRRLQKDKQIDIVFYQAAERPSSRINVGDNRVDLIH